VPERSRALALFQRAAEAVPGHRVAIQQARRVCVDQGLLDGAADLLEAELRIERDPQARAMLSVLLAELLLDLGQRERAMRHLVRATALYPEEAALHEALGTAGGGVGWQGEVARLSELARQAPPAEAARHCRRAARTLRLEAPEHPDYEWLLIRAFAYDPGDPTVGALLEAHFARQSAWRELAIVQGERVAVAGEPDQKAALCLNYAFLWHERLSDADRASAWAFEALARGAVQFPIAAATLLAELLGPRGAWDSLLLRLDELTAQPLDEDAYVFVRLLGARVLWQEKKDLGRTRASLDGVRHLAAQHPVVVAFDDAFATSENLSPEQVALMEAAEALEAHAVDRAIDAWKRAIAAEPSRRAPHRQLARLCRQHQRWRALSDALQAQEAAAALAPDDHLALLFELAALYRDQLRHDLHFENTLKRILLLKPDSLAALDMLAAHHNALRRWRDLVATLGRMLPVVQPAERVALHLSRAQILSERLADDKSAVKEIEQALALAPGDAQLVAQLDQTYERRRMWDRLLALRAAQIERVKDPRERLERAVELARFAAQRVRTPPLVIEAWEAVTALDPHHAEALAVLEQLYGRERRFGRLAEVYTRQAEGAPDARQKATFLQKLAIVYAERLEDAPAAIQAWNAVLAVVPHHPRAEEALKRLFVETRAWDALEAFFAERGKLDECARLLEQRVESEEAPTRVALWERIARLYHDALDRPERARRAWESLRELEPNHAAAAVALISHYEQARDLLRLAEVLAVQLEHTSQPEARHVRLRRLADLHADGLGDYPGALRWLLRAFAEDPTHEGVRRQLGELAGKTGAFARLGEAYEAALPRLAAPSEALPVLRALAELRERDLGDADAALATWRRVLELDGEDAAALDALERLYLARQSFGELQAIYQRRLDLLDGAVARRPLRIKMARLAEEMGDLAGAVAAYQAVLEAAPEDRRTLEALERLHRRQEDWPALARVLEQHLALDPEDVEPRFDLAALREAHLHDVTAAIEGYRRVLELSPGHAGARDALERHFAAGPHRFAVARILDPIYQRAGEYDRLIGVRELFLEESDDPARRVELLHDIAELLEAKLQRPAQAFDALARALRADPSNRATLDRLERLAAALGAWEPLVGVYREVAQRPLALAQQIELRCRLGALYKDKLGQRERAIATFSRVLDLDAKNSLAAAALRELDRV
jgi:tetratricopeptide (TPR) repeat protein